MQRGSRRDQNGSGNREAGSTTDARNTQWLRVMEKLGMKREGLLRRDRLFRGELVDEVVCGMLRSEWQTVIPTREPTHGRTARD